MQRNLRILTFADRFDNARMLASEFSSSERLAKLFDTCFFPAAAGRRSNPAQDLPIQPRRVAERGGRSLLLNATALNTGHQFQMTGGFVGETGRPR